MISTNWMESHFSSWHVGDRQIATGKTQRYHYRHTQEYMMDSCLQYLTTWN